MIPGIVQSQLQMTGTLGYVLTVLQDEPVVYYRLGESSGSTAEDSSGNNLDGTYSGAPSYSESSLITTGSAIAFDGTADQLSLSGAPSVQIVGDLTLELWVNVTSPSDGGAFICATPAVPSENEADNITYLVFMDSAGYLSAFHEYGGGSDEGVQFGCDISSGQTYHLVVVRDVSEKTYALYVNGIKMSEKTYANDPTGGSNAIFRVNGTGVVDEYLGATFDEVAVYDTVLSEERVIAHYLAGIGANAPSVNTKVSEGGDVKITEGSDIKTTEG